MRTDNAWSPQAAKTQDVAAAWIAAKLAVVHWHLRSLAPQVVADLTASAIQVVAQAGMAAEANPENAMTARAEYAYFILAVVVMLVVALSE